jgi:hypothetical protein
MIIAGHTLKFKTCVVLILQEKNKESHNNRYLRYRNPHTAYKVSLHSVKVRSNVQLIKQNHRAHVFFFFKKWLLTDAVN